MKMHWCLHHGHCGLISALSVLHILMELSSFTTASVPLAPSVTVRPASTPVPTEPPVKHVPAVNFLPLANMKLSRLGTMDAAEAAYLDPHRNITSNDPDVEIRPQSTEDAEWKTRMIVVCTITAATELFFALLIIVYWKELRWSFRKITCPCDENTSSESGSHQRMTVLPRRQHHGSSSSELDFNDVNVTFYHQPPHPPSQQHEREPLYSSGGEEVDEEAAAGGSSRHNTSQQQQQHEVTYAVPSTSRGMSSSVVLHPHHLLPLGRVMCEDSSDDDGDDVLSSVYVASNR